MSTLGDAVQARIPAARLARLTAQGSASSTTVNVPLLELAVTDLTAAFPQYVGSTFDSSNAAHIALGIDGVLATLQDWIGLDAEKSYRDEWRKQAEALARIGARARVLAISPYTLGPTPGTYTGRPDFDGSRFPSQTINPPPTDDREP